MLRRGTIVKWNDDKAFGFIAPDDGDDDLFFHVRSMVAPERRPQAGDLVFYEVGIGSKGPRAERVSLRAGSSSLPSRRENIPRRRAARSVREPTSVRALSLLFALLWPATVLGAFWLAASRGFIPPWVADLYLGMSTITALAYAVDKHRAKSGKWRIAEGTLQLFSMAGGWPGAFVAQRFFRHKTSKLPFQITYWIIVATHFAFWSWFTAAQSGLLST